MSMRYPLYYLNCDEFENLVILICNHILGSATIPFAKGKDGGKDGKLLVKPTKSRVNLVHGMGKSLYKLSIQRKLMHLVLNLLSVGL